MAEKDEREHDLYDDEAPRSIFSAMWFRALIVVLVLGVVAAVAVPYVLDLVGSPATKQTAAVKPPAPATSAPATTAAPTRATSPTGTAPQAAVVASSKPADAAKSSDATKAADSASKAGQAAKVETAKPADPGKSAAASAVKADAPKPSQAKTPTAKDASAKAAAGKPDATKSDTTRLDATKTEGARPDSARPEAASTVIAKTDAAKTETATPTDNAAKPATDAAKAAAKTATAAKATTTAGSYWVQVGAFKDPATAKRVASKLREQNFPVEESQKSANGGMTAASPSASPGTDRYNVFVSGLAPAELNSKLGAKGLTTQPVAGGVVVTPSLPLREAVALSKDLATDGLKVQVRRTGGPSAPAGAPGASAAGGGETLHRVRIGGFADRAAAVAAVKELEAKGYKGYVARGNE